MVEEFDVHELASRADTLSLPDVVGTGSGVTRRVVVEENDRYGVCQKCPFDDCSGVNDGRRKAAPREKLL